MFVIAESITGVSPLSAPLLEEVDVGLLQGDGAGGLQLTGAQEVGRARWKTGEQEGSLK